jgi:hypothetical protein
MFPGSARNPFPVIRFKDDGSSLIGKKGNRPITGSKRSRDFGETG